MPRSNAKKAKDKEEGELESSNAADEFVSSDKEEQKKDLAILIMAVVVLILFFLASGIAIFSGG